MGDPSRLPVIVLTGFLGSGKTTLLNAILRRSEMARTAVLINEFGEVPIDHHLVRAVDARVLLLEGGCVCCAVLGDLVGALRELRERVARAEIAPFARVLIETTGMADPAQLVATLVQHQEITEYFALTCVVTTADAEHAVQQLERYAEAARQLAAADVVVITKTDRVGAEATAALRAELARINPMATVVEAVGGAVDPTPWLAPAEHPVREHIVPEGASVLRWRHDARVKTFAVTLDGPVRGSSFALWASLLTQLQGEHILRIKGLVNVLGVPSPQVFHAVQHVVYPAEGLAAWPDGDARTRLVFITRGLDAGSISQIVASLRAAVA